MIINIRASSLDGYGDCSRRVAASLFRDTIEGAGYKLRRLTPGVGAAIGTSVHKAAAHMLTEKMETGGEPDREDATEVAVETFMGEIEYGVMWDDCVASEATTRTIKSDPSPAKSRALLCQRSSRWRSRN